MGKILLICRLALRDLRRRPAEAVLLLLAITAAATTLTLGLVLNGVSSQPYQQTREATAGPDLVAHTDPAGTDAISAAYQAELAALIHDPKVIGHSGPYPATWAVLKANGHTVGAEVQGRDPAPAQVDQPKLTQGSWVGADGTAVVERSLADALGVGTGDSITLGDRPFRVAGIAVTAAITPYPATCLGGCEPNTSPQVHNNSGLVWLTQTDTRNVATPAEPLYYLLNLKLADPADADAFAAHYNANARRPAPDVESWRYISHRDARLVDTVRLNMLAGGSLLGLLAAASVAVLVGGRMTDQTRRVGLLKAVGGTPELIAAVLLAEYLFLALLAAAIGLAVGRLVAPAFTSAGSGLLGTTGTPPLTALTAGTVAGVAMLVAITATFVPAIRAARTSTVQALADAARPPRRRAWLIALSARLPVPLLLGLRLAARRPRRVVLAVASIAITASGIVAILITHARMSAQRLSGSAALDNPQGDKLDQVMLLITLAMGALAAVNAIFIAWATVLDARRSSALARALGATPQQVTAGLVSAQVVPALVGALLGIPGGFLLCVSVKHGDTITYPPASWLIAVVLGTLVGVAGLTAIPVRIGARRPVVEILQSEHA